MGRIFFGVPQASILGSLLFNIFLCDLFSNDESYRFSKLGRQQYTLIIGKDINEVIQSLEHDSLKLFQWFKDNKWRPIKILVIS